MSFEKSIIEKWNMWLATQTDTYLETKIYVEKKICANQRLEDQKHNESKPFVLVEKKINHL